MDLALTSLGGINVEMNMWIKLSNRIQFPRGNNIGACLSIDYFSCNSTCYQTCKINNHRITSSYCDYNVFIHFNHILLQACTNHFKEIYSGASMA